VTPTPHASSAWHESRARADITSALPTQNAPLVQGSLRWPDMDRRREMGNELLSGTPAALRAHKPARCGQEPHGCRRGRRQIDQRTPSIGYCVDRLNPGGPNCNTFSTRSRAIAVRRTSSSTHLSASTQSTGPTRDRPGLSEPYHWAPRIGGTATNPTLDTRTLDRYVH